MGTSSPAQRKRRTPVNGVFAIEGDWWGIRNPATMEPALQLLASTGDRSFKYIHRNCDSREQFEYYVRKWTLQGMAEYPILYLGFHGDEHGIYVGDKRTRNSRITLNHLAEWVSGRCKRRIIHFGSCGTLAQHGHHLNTFLRITEATAVCGYRGDPDWLHSAAFEIILLNELHRARLTEKGLEKAKASVQKMAAPLVRAMDFRMQIART